METLSVKYRPSKFEDVCGQGATIRILERQLELKQFKNAYLFVGPSGVGKTTMARIFANGINGGVGAPIEIDAASNNGVDNVKTIVANAEERSLDSEYKIYIIDECHSLTNQAWQSFLKCIEEPPKYTIFIFCTTDVQKVPETITNRVQRFNLSRIPTDVIRDRLEYICKVENIKNYIETVTYISKISNGSLRQAISYLEKCIDFSTTLDINNTFDILGNYSLSLFFDLTDMIIDKDKSNIVKLINSVNNKGQDLKLFISNYLTFVLDLSKYCLFKDLDSTQIPQSMLDEVNYTTNNGSQLGYFVHLQNKVLEIKNTLIYDNSVYTTVTIMLLALTEG